MVNIKLNKYIVDMDMISADLKYLYKNINDIKNEILLLETEVVNHECLESYLVNLVDFCSDAVDEMEILQNTFEEVEVLMLACTQMFGEKKACKVKELLDPLNSFLKSFG